LTENKDNGSNGGNGNGAKPAPAPAPNKKVTSTPKQKALAKIIVTQPTLSDADKLRRSDHAESVARHHAGRMINAPGTQAEVARLMQGAGVEFQDVFKTVRQVMKLPRRPKPGDKQVVLASARTFLEVGGFLNRSQDITAVQNLIIAVVTEAGDRFVDRTKLAAYLRFCAARLRGGDPPIDVTPTTTVGGQGT
jgi:hypothetical protein